MERYLQVTPNATRKSLSAINVNLIDNRESLKTVEKSNENKNPLKSREGIKKTPGPLKIYEDVDSRQLAKSQQDTLVTTATQTEGATCLCSCHVCAETSDVEAEAYRLMVQEDVPPEYWKELAERRREALDDSLRENQKLHETAERLRQENADLAELASQADYFASILKTLTSESADGGGEAECPTITETERESQVEGSHDVDTESDSTDD